MTVLAALLGAAAELVISWLIKEVGLKNGAVLWPLRIAIAGVANTPGGAFEIAGTAGPGGNPAAPGGRPAQAGERIRYPQGDRKLGSSIKQY